MVSNHFYVEVQKKALGYFSKDKFEQEFQKSREEFFENSSVLDESNPNYFVRIEQFLDWYFFSRPLNDFRLPPSHCVFMLPDLRWDPQEEDFAAALKEVKHSLFEVLKVKKDEIQLQDLFFKNKWDVPLGAQAQLFSKNQIFDGRILVKGKETWLLHSKCFHSEEARTFLLAEIKKYQKDLDLDRERFLLVTLKMRYLFERYPHAKIEQIYSWQNRWIENEFKNK
jgi:hypothetical protein